MAETKHSSMSLHAHGDGTYHTHSPARSGGDSGWYPGEREGKDPSRVDHKSFGAAVMHMAKHHGTEGDHMHIHGHEDGYTTHHVIEDGKVEGPHEHASMGALKRHIGDCMEGDE